MTTIKRFAFILCALAPVVCAQTSNYQPTPEAKAAAEKWACRDDLRTSGTMVIRVSRGVAQGNVIEKVPPTVDPNSISSDQQVLVQILIDKTGAVACARLLNVVGFSADDILRVKSLEAAQQWKFKPYLLNGNPVHVETDLLFAFKP